MISFIQLLRGYVRIKVWGFSPERFMNLCSHKNILLWDICKTEDAYYMYISLKAFYQLKPITRKTKTRVVILKRYGLPFLLPRLWIRKFFFIGLLVCLIVWIASSRYIWNIEIQGNYSITEDVMLQFLKEQGVQIGVKAGEIDEGNLESKLRKEFDLITWASIKRYGTKLYVSVKENEMITENQTNMLEAPCDLVAQVEGKIISIIVRKGVPKVKPGDLVVAGDILVDGRVPIYQEDTTIKSYQEQIADADIEMEYKIPVIEYLNGNYEEKNYTGRSCQIPFIQIFHTRLLLPGKSSSYLTSDTIEQKNQLKLLKQLPLPIYFGKLETREYYLLEKKYTKEEAMEQLKYRFAKLIDGLEEKGVQIVEKNVKIENNSNMWILHGSLLAHGSNYRIERSQGIHE